MNGGSLADRPGNPATFLILGSASPQLVKGASESLAGRVNFISMGGLNCAEVGTETRNRLWLRGGFPDSYLAASDEVRGLWRRSFVKTRLHQDLPELGIDIPAERLRRFWIMAAHYHGQTWNSSAIAKSLDISHTIARSYLDILTGAHVMRQLPPFVANVGKRVVKVEVAPALGVPDPWILME